MGYADDLTDKELKKLEKRIAEEYGRAYREMRSTANQYFATLKKRYDAEYQAFLDGKYTEAEFKAWYRTQVERGERYRKMEQDLANRMADANQWASAYVNDKTPSIYSMNANYQAYEIEQRTGVDFALYNEQTVKRMIEGENHTEFRVLNPNRARDYEWNTRQIQSALTAGILQGKPIDKLADSFMDVMKRNRASAIRNARTAFTSAQNGGKQDTFDRAEEMGIEIQKEWVATLDERTRQSHQDLDGEIVGKDEAFSNGLMYPADPEGEPCEVYNCRCTMRAVLPKHPYITHRQTYKEWIEEKQSQENPQQRERETDNEVISALRTSNIYALDVKDLNSDLTSEEIVGKLAGGDKTRGSCMSLSFAYMANRKGFDVTDFRGGDSQDFFSTNSNIEKILTSLNLDARLEKDYNELKMGVKLLKSMEEGKEYCLIIGRHASIVRNSSGIFEYLEMQSSVKNGWKPFNGNPRYTLNKRFKAQEKTTFAGYKYMQRAWLIDADKFPHNEDAREIMAYINTNAKEQKKGQGGHEK